MKRFTIKWMSWLMTFCLLLGLTQPFAITAHAAPEPKWLTYKNDDFSNPNLINLFALNGTSTVKTDNKGRKVLRLTEAVNNKFGTTFSKKLIAPGNHYSFSTFFKFRMNETGVGNPADGITFTVQAQSNTAGAVGVGIGYGGITPSFAVKFDTYQNTDKGDPSNNYVGLALNGDVQNVAGRYQTLNKNTLNLSGGDDLFSWIDYDGEQNNVKVYLSKTDIRPATPLLDVNEINLDQIFAGKSGVYAGFTAATGGAVETHDILSWYFINEHDPINTSLYTYKQAPSDIRLETKPTGVPGKFTVTATVYDEDGVIVPDAPVSLSSTQGQLAQSNQKSDTNGQVSTVLDFGTHPPGGQIKATTVGGAYVTLPLTSAPINLTAGTTPETASTLTWNTVNGATSYNVYKDGALIATNVTTATYKVNNLTPGEFASFTVTAVKKSEDGVMESAPSNSVTIPRANGISLDSIEYTLVLGASHQTVVSSVYADGTSLNVTPYSLFSASSGNVATVNSSGLVTATGAGTTVIQAVYNGQTLTTTVTVTVPAPTGVTVTDVTSTGAALHWQAVPGAQSYDIYDNGKLVASGVTGTGYNITGLQAATSHNFTVKAVSNGISSPASDGAAATTSNLRELKVEPSVYTLAPGATQPTKLTAVYLNETVQDATKKATYSSSNPNVATVDANGVITAKSPGTAIITMVYDGRTITQTIVVPDQGPPFQVTVQATPDAAAGDGKSTVTLRAHVTTPDGKPAAGVPVTFHFGKGTLGDRIVISNEQGVAELNYTTPVLPGIVPVTEAITATATDPESNKSSVQSTNVTYTPAAVHGVVVNQVTGKPVAGATVTVTADFNDDGIVDFTTTVTTDENGAYQMPVPRGNFTYALNIAAPVQIGDKTVTLHTKQTAVVGNLPAAGQQIEPPSKLNGQLLISKSATSDTAPTAGSFFGTGNVQALVQGTNGSNFQVMLPVDDNGSFDVNQVPQGTYKVTYQIKAPDGTLLAGPSANVKIDRTGEVGLVYSLIDPYGVVTDAGTGRPVSGVTTKLFWADTDLNKLKGRTPHTEVSLPELPGFAPNQNHNPQLTDSAGEYAWMVYPDGDYYIVATKSGYYSYSTLDTKPNAPATGGSDSYIENGIIHVGQDIVNFNFAMKKIPEESSSGSGGSAYLPPASDLSLSLSVDKSLVKEGEKSTISVNYKNYSSQASQAGVVTVILPAGAKVINANGGIVEGNTIKWKVADLAAGQTGSFKIDVQWDLLKSAEAQQDITGQFTIGDQAATAAKTDASVKVKVFSDRFDTLKHQRYILGYPDGKFHPDSSLTRAELAAIVARLTESVTIDEAVSYADVQDNHWAANYIKIATKHGYFSGFHDGSFRPEAQVTRGELASVMARYLKLNVSSTGDNHFTDVHNHWAGDAIESLYRGKFLAGYTDGSFKPQDQIRRVEAVTMINRMLYRGPLKGLDPLFPDVADSHWGFGDVQEATVSHEAVRNSDGSETWKYKLTDDVQ